MLNYQRLISFNLFNTFFLCIIFYPKYLHGQSAAVIRYEYYSAASKYLNITEDALTTGVVSSRGSQSAVLNAQAFLLVDAYGRYDGCQPSVKPVNTSNRVAIIQRGGDCTFSVKITRAKTYGASAVIIYDPANDGQGLFDMLHNTSDVLSMYVQQSIGSLLFNLANDSKTHLNITIEPLNTDYDTSTQGGFLYGSKAATIFISVSVCILVTLCISWFVFYFCQRYRSRTVKDRLQNRLTNAAKKAVSKIKLATITQPPVVEESCVICLDIIKVGDTVRHILCGHTFHQHCVDPWLLSHRHCPLCNLDILAAYKVSIPGMNHPHRTDATIYTIPMSLTSLATTAATPIAEQQETANNMEIPSISGSLKEDLNGEQNLSFRTDDEH